jgi:hypothetical protein
MSEVHTESFDATRIEVLGPPRDIEVVNTVHTTQTPTLQQSNAFQHLFSCFNTGCFDDRLLSDDVLIDHAATGRTYGHFLPNAFTGLADDGLTRKIHQIAINPARIQAVRQSGDALTDVAVVDFRELAQTLVHEMAHYADHLYGKPAKGGRHSRSWGRIMKAAGLHPSSTGAPGGGEHGVHMVEYVIPGGRFEVAFERLLREQPVIWRIVRSQVLSGNTEPKPSKRTKFSCSKCGFSQQLTGTAIDQLVHISCGVDAFMVPEA